MRIDRQHSRRHIQKKSLLGLIAQEVTEFAFTVYLFLFIAN